MKIKHIFSAALTVAVVGIAQSATSAQAAILGASSQCANVSFSYIDCAGYFDGNDKGAQGSGINNLNSLFGSDWSYVGDQESGTVSFISGGEGSESGKASTNLSGAGAIAVKAGNSYSLYTVADLSSFDWSTTGVKGVGKKGNVPGLSHLSVYQSVLDQEPEKPQEVPEPGILLGLVGFAGMGARLKQKLS